MLERFRTAKERNQRLPARMRLANANLLRGQHAYFARGDIGLSGRHSPAVTGNGSTRHRSSIKRAHRFHVSDWFIDRMIVLSLSVVVFCVLLTSSYPRTTEIYWGTYNPDVPWNTVAWDRFEAKVGKSQSIIHFGNPWFWNDQFHRLDLPMLERIHNRGAIPMVDWGAWELGRGPDQPDFALREISSGRYDDYIRHWARDAKSHGHPFFVRFNWEMNGWWQFPWAEQLNGNQPGDYVPAWRHVHDIFMEEGATNVMWVWAPNVISARSTPLESVYPGDEYVDWVGMDGYNFGTDSGNNWQSFADLFGPTYEALQHLAPEKPIMIAEFASSEHGGDKAAWILDAFSVQIPKHFPAIRAVVWFNWDIDDPNLSWPLTSSPNAVDAFREAIELDYYETNCHEILARTTGTHPCDAEDGLS